LESVALPFLSTACLPISCIAELASTIYVVSIVHVSETSVALEACTFANLNAAGMHVCNSASLVRAQSSRGFKAMGKLVRASIHTTVCLLNTARALVGVVACVAMARDSLSAIFQHETTATLESVA
jgi:hypothetical protein